MAGKKSNPSSRNGKPGFLRRLLRLIARGFIGFVGISFVWVLALRYLPPPVNVLMIGRWFALQGEDPRLDYRYRSLEKISPNLGLAVIAAEDQRFVQHKGFDLEAIEKALEHNRKGKKLRGASTISQQTAKNVFLWPARSWVRKALEVWFTALIELLWGKERILEVYVNIAEFGSGIYGAEAAAQRFFGKSAEKLSRGEAAVLAAVLPSPRRYSAVSPSGYVRRRQSWILRQMSNLVSLEEVLHPKTEEATKKKKSRKK